MKPKLARTRTTSLDSECSLWAERAFAGEDPENVVVCSESTSYLRHLAQSPLVLPRVFHPCFPSRQSFGLISASRDGDLVSILIERSGYGTIRGSSSRKGVVALRQLVDALAAGMNVLITPDGPRGPVYEASQGVVFLAQKTGAPVVPINMEYSSCWR